MDCGSTLVFILLLIAIIYIIIVIFKIYILNKKSCDPDNKPSCSENQKAKCVDGRWICRNLPDIKKCNPADKPLCPAGAGSICVNGNWVCLFDEKVYTGSTINDNPQTTRFVNGNMICQQYDISNGNNSIPKINYLSNFYTVVIDFSDPSFQNNEDTGFLYNGGYYTTGQSMFYSQYTWNSVKNPSPIIGLDLYAQWYYPQTIDDITHDNTICDVILFMYDPTTYNSTDDSFQYIMCTTIFSGTWADYKSIIDNCDNIVNFGNFVPVKGNGWKQNPNIVITESMTVGFCFGFFSNESLFYLNTYTGNYENYSIRQINNDTSSGNGGSCPAKDPLNFRIYKTGVI